ncbi:MAG TPA: NB-ARC domain-containing protein [Verrucomicrobiae bacterium]|nr:NB-ARC domain-containing protein [Verrucomicrobiae bacterium]
MTIETSRLPTHLALVARRVNVCSPDDLATRFLETSYFAEAFLKTIAVVLYAGLVKPARDVAYRQAHELVRGDGLGTWEQSVRDITTQPTAGYLPPEFFSLLAWLSKKRTKAEDEWFRVVLANAHKVLVLLGCDEKEISKGMTAKELITSFVQIRNKTKAHGAVGEDFYLAANKAYLEAVSGLVASCPICEWKWVHLVPRESGKLRGVALEGTDPKHMRDADIAHYSIESGGVHFVPLQSSRAFFCGDLLKSNRECSAFTLPNGGLTETGFCEFIDYGSGKTTKESAAAFLAPPSPLPSSETEGLDSFDIQSNTYGNLPELPTSYVKRLKLEGDLTARLMDTNHPVITLHGGGGMGKTSLALAVSHDLAAATTPRFEHIVWFSARDVDLRPTGPSEVRPEVFDLKSVSKKFGRLFSDWGGEGNTEALAKALQSPAGVSSRGILFVFDNFETMADVRGLHKFLDEHTHLPNKVLITSRERAFVADYPIEVRGMERDEAEQLLLTTARSLGVEHLMTGEIIDRIYLYTGGHAYMMRVVVGEMAKDGRYSPPPQLMGRRQDIVDAIFERSFNKLSEAGRNVFLLIANWKANVPELGLIVVLGSRGVDAMAGLEECRRLSLVYQVELPGEQAFYSVPTLARNFAHKKLQGDPDRLVIQQDLATLHKFGVVIPMHSGADSDSKLIAHFVAACFQEITKGNENIDRADKLLEALATAWPPGWRKLAQFRRQTGASRDEIGYALRRAVEEEPFSKDAWLDRAKFAHEIGDESVRMASLVSAVDADPKDIELIKEVAFQLCRYVNSHIYEIPKARRGVYLASVRAHMQRVANELDATALSRLAWLFLLEENVTKAREYANRGCELEPLNKYCLKILERLDNQSRGGFEE